MEHQQSYLAKLSDPKYLNVIYSWYEQFSRTHKTRKKLETLENELSWFNGMKSEHNTADYQGFFKYVYEHYSPQKMTQSEAGTKAIIEDKNGDYPIIFYYILLYSKKYKVFKEYDARLKEEQSTNDPTFLKSGFAAYNEWKLLANLLENFNTIVASVIEAINEEHVDNLDDNLDQLNTTTIKARMIKAVSMHEKTLALKLFERLKDLPDGEINYLQALINYADSKYSNVIKYATKVTSGDIDYRSAVALELESLAYLGDHEAFFTRLQETNDGQIDPYHLIFLLQILVLNIKKDEIQAFDFTNYIDLSKVTCVDSKNTYYIGNTLQIFARCLVEGILLLDDHLYNKSLTSEANDTSSGPVEDRLKQLQLVMRLYPNEIPDFLNIKYVAANPIILCKKQILSAILSMLTKNNPDTNFENLCYAFLCEYQLGFIKEFCDNVNSNLTALIHYYERGEQKAFDLMCIAYLEELLMGSVDHALKAFITTSGLVTNTMRIASEITDSKLQSSLSEEGKLALQIAEWQYEKASKEDYSWKDHSMISLSFFRALEVELNQKIVQPILKTISMTDVERSFNSMIDTLNTNTEAKQAFVKKWGQIINSMQSGIDNGMQNNGFVLGALYQFMKNIGSQYDGNDTLAQAFFSPLFTILNDTGFKALSSGEFEELICDHRRFNYRNPSVGLTSQSFEKASECRTFVYDSLKQIMEWLL